MKIFSILSGTVFIALTVRDIEILNKLCDFI